MQNILVVYKRSAFEHYNESPDGRVREYARKSDAIMGAHERHYRSLGQVLAVLDRTCNYDLVSRAQHAGGGHDLTITVGGDGTFLDASHYVHSGLILGVNSDPASSVGFYCSSTTSTFASDLHALEKRPRTELTRMELAIDGKKLVEPALNDILLAHHNPAATTRFTVDGGAQLRCSGLLACTATGSTAWMYQEGGQVMELGDRRIQYQTRGIREAAPRFTNALRLRSFTREAKLFIDGEHLSYDVCLGQELTITAGTPLLVAGDLERNRKAFLAARAHD